MTIKLVTRHFMCNFSFAAISNIASSLLKDVVKDRLQGLPINIDEVNINCNMGTGVAARFIISQAAKLYDAELELYYGNITVGLENISITTEKPFESLEPLFKLLNAHMRPSDYLEFSITQPYEEVQRVRVVFNPFGEYSFKYGTRKITFEF